MFRFENPSLLYLLALIIPVIVCFYWTLYSRRKNIQKLGSLDLIAILTPEYSSGKTKIKFYLSALVFLLLIVALANPQMGTKVEKIERKGVDIMIALDISESMNCEDIQPSRLMRAKQSIIKLLDKLKNDRIGLVVFAGDAYVQLPLTSDYGAAKLFISNVQTSDMSLQGTAIGKAIDLCMQSFDEKQKDKKNKAIIVISDGEDHEDGGIEAAGKAASQNIMVNTIGMGLPQGGPIPIYIRSQLMGYKKDRDGNVVVTRLNEQMLQEIAKAGKGFYVGANNASAGVETVFEKLNSLEKTLHDSRNISGYESLYRYLMYAILALLILDMFLFERKNKVFNEQSLFGTKKTKKILSILAFFALSLPLHAQSENSLLRSGNKAYKNEQYNQAETYYRKSLSKDSTQAKASYNLGNALYKQDMHEDAQKNYLKALQNPNLTPSQKSSLFYNLGNTYMQGQAYDKSIEAYKQALRVNPKDEDTKYNLAYAQKMLKKQQEQNQQQQNQDKDQNKDNKQDKKENQENQDQNKKEDQKQDKDQQKNKDQPDQNPNNKNKEKSGKEPEKMQASEAERMLNALDNQEKNTLEKVKKQQIPARNKHIEKDW